MYVFCPLPILPEADEIVVPLTLEGTGDLHWN